MTKTTRFQSMPSANTSAELFRHVSADKTSTYRSIMNSFAAAKRQFRLHMRPDEVLADNFSFIMVEKNSPLYTQKFSVEGKKLLADMKALLQKK